MTLHVSRNEQPASEILGRTISAPFEAKHDHFESIQCSESFSVSAVRTSAGDIFLDANQRRKTKLSAFIDHENPFICWLRSSLERLSDALGKKLGKVHVGTGRSSLAAARAPQRFRLALLIRLAFR